MKRFIACIAILLGAGIASAEDRSAWREPDWSKYLCSARSGVREFQGVAEYRLPDGSRVDILTDTTAFEVEWAAKWKESIGQSVWYSIASGKLPGVILLAKDPEAEKADYLRCVAVCQRLGIRLYHFDTRLDRGGQ